MIRLWQEGSIFIVEEDRLNRIAHDTMESAKSDYEKRRAARAARLKSGGTILDNLERQEVPREYKEREVTW